MPGRRPCPVPTGKKTLRRLPPTTRKLAKLVDELHSVARRLNNLLSDIRGAEITDLAQRRATSPEGQASLKNVAADRARLFEATR